MKNNQHKEIRKGKLIRLKSDICVKCGKKISFIPTQMNIHLINCNGK